VTPRNTTPEGFRTAAYLATKARLDAAARSRTGKTARAVDCNPPNVKCGGRCIPPNWDCRLKGQGADPHLRAVRTDPVSGLANVERGVKRLGKGISKGSFSEIEGGKRAIVRGIVKAVPGDLQRKQALQAQLERRAGGIALGLSIVGFGLFSHSQLKRAPFYRDGVGRQIDDAVAAGINRVLDVTPGIRGARAERRAAGAAAAGAAAARAAGEAATGPTALKEELLRTPTQLELRATDYGNAKVLFNRVSAVDVDADSRGANAETWRQQSLEAFWSTKRTNAAGAGDGSTFSESATHEYLSRQFGFRLGAGATDTDVRRALTGALNREAASLQALARQQGVNIKDTEARSRFLNGLVGPSTENFPENVRERAVGKLNQILGDAPSTRAAAVSRTELAQSFYRETRDGFDEYFRHIADEVRQTPGVAMPTEQRQKGYSDLLNSARIGHSRYLARLLVKPDNVTSRIGQGLSDAISKEYFARKVKKSSTFSLSDREVRTAASELAGRDITGLADATRYLQQNGFERLVAVRAAGQPAPGTRAAAAATPPRGRRSPQAQITDLARSLREAAQRRGEDMSLEASYRAARSEISRRQRGDALPPGLIHAATYLAVREDLQGKPCGASHIPKAHECRKGAGSVSQEKQPPESGPSTDIKRKAALAAAVVGGALAMGAAGSVAYNIKTLRDPTKSPLDPSPSIKDLVKSMKQEAGTKSASEAMGHYYTKKSGLKPGDVVYFRHEKDPVAHFGIYLGEGKDGIVRAVFANTHESRFSWTDVAEIGATKPGIKTSMALMTPLVKAPDPKFKQSASSFSNEDVVRRAIRIANTDYKFSLTRDNCETLANGIAYGVPESEQLQRFRRATRVFVDVVVSRGQRREAREAIYQGRARGRSYTAREFVTFLEGQREFSSPAGKELAKQYAQYFQNSRLDAEAATNGLISPDELWSRIKSYGPALKARAMADYLLIQRSLLELDGPA